MDWAAFVHTFKDLFIYLPTWILSQLQIFLANIFTPISWFFNFFKGFVSGINSTSTLTLLEWNFDNSTLSFFQAIPYWNYLMFGIGAGISILLLVFIFRRFADF